MVKVSIIIPIYNAEGLLRRLLESIKNQTLQDIEVIMIDDGSTDGSPAICDEYVESDSRFKVLHKQNEGVAAARQNGIDMAQGEYTIHADADDWVEPNMYEVLYTAAKGNDADVVSCDFYEEYENESRYISQKPKSLDKDSLLSQYVASELERQLWDKLIRRSCYENYYLSFPKGVNKWQDVLVVCKLLQHPVKFVHVDGAFYHYDLFSSPTSIGRFVSRKGYLAQKFVTDAICNDLRDMDMFSDACFTMKSHTKMLAFSVPDVSLEEYLNLYTELGTRYLYGKLKNKGIADKFEFLTIIFRSGIFRNLCLRLKKVHS